MILDAANINGDAKLHNAVGAAAGVSYPAQVNSDRQPRWPIYGYAVTRQLDESTSQKPIFYGFGAAASQSSSGHPR